MNRALAALASVVFVVVAAACVPIERKAECADADACDAARDDPYGSFVATDAQFGDVGTCWQNEETAKACVTECNNFITDERIIAEGDNGACEVSADCPQNQGFTCLNAKCVTVINVPLINACGG